MAGEASEGGVRDFDFLRGDWLVRHRRLAARLVGSQQWDVFDGTMTSRSILGGQANVDDNVLDLPSGQIRAAALRAFDPATQLWSIWWLSSQLLTALGVPLLGCFHAEVGTFYCDEIVSGRAVRTRFLWTATDTPTPAWEQAHSIDGGFTWETNWHMRFQRLRQT